MLRFHRILFSIGLLFLTPEQTWKRSTPEEQGIDSRALIEVLKKVSEESLDIHSLIIIRNHRVTLECYLHPYDASVLHNVKSVSKSIMSALTGIALKEGIIQDIDQTVNEFFPQYFAKNGDPEKEKINLRHLLTMTAGLDLDENGPIEERIYESGDWIRATLERPVKDPPGTRFNYSTPLSHIMSGILSETSGRTLLELARQYLFDPMEAGEAMWTKGPGGYCFGGAELFMTPSAMARFGILYLNNGIWGGKELVPSKWVSLSTQNRLPITEEKRRYGYWWWTSDTGNYGAQGWGGQIISVKPSLGMVTVTTAANMEDALSVFRLLRPIQPAPGSLPENRTALAEMNRIVRDLANPPAEPVSILPETAKKISGNRYELETPHRGLKRLGFEFNGNKQCIAHFLTELGEVQAEVGLDGLYRITDTGRFGRMPAENHLALRGKWLDQETFRLHFHFLGEPWRDEMDIRFHEGGIEIDAIVHPTEYKYSCRGVLMGRGEREN